MNWNATYRQHAEEGSYFSRSTRMVDLHKRQCEDESMVAKCHVGRLAESTIGKSRDSRFERHSRDSVSTNISRFAFFSLRSNCYVGSNIGETS